MKEESDREVIEDARVDYKAGRFKRVRALLRGSKEQEK